MFKKKKYEHSDWFTGLLQAEDHEHSAVKYSVTPHGLYYKLDCGVDNMLFNSYSYEHLEGMLDYLDYKQSVLDKLNE